MHDTSERRHARGRVSEWNTYWYCGDQLRNEFESLRGELSLGRRDESQDSCRLGALGEPVMPTVCEVSVIGDRDILQTRFREGCGSSS